MHTEREVSLAEIVLVTYKLPVTVPNHHFNIGPKFAGVISPFPLANQYN